MIFTPALLFVVAHSHGDPFTGGNMDKIAAAIDKVQAPITGTPEQYSSKGAASDLIKGMSRVAGPRPRLAQKLFIDPALTSSPDACDRDYSVTCPEGFVQVGEVHGAPGSNYCAPSSGYDGRCPDQAADFTGWKKSELERFSKQCEANWPCRECNRDFSAPCPVGWAREEDGCAPPSDYFSPCAEKADFSGFSPKMKSHWSSLCKAWFPCA